MALNSHDISAFLNSLQLSVKSSIDSITLIGTDSIVINFDAIQNSDPGLDLFTTFFPGKWDKNHKSYEVDFLKMDLDLHFVTNFLLLTRLNLENIKKMIPSGHFDKILCGRMKKIEERILNDTGLDSLTKETQNIEDFKKFFFDSVKQKKMTLREISERSGLTQAAISNFKSGTDIRLSTLLKLCQAVNLKLFLRTSNS